MTVIDMKTITCNGPNCNKSIAFSNEEAKDIIAKTEWLRGLILVQTADQRNFSYCCATCLVEHCSTGQLAPPEEKKLFTIDEGKSQLAMEHARRLAEAKRQSDQALKTGAPVRL